jgi:hypothetical protein
MAKKKAAKKKVAKKSVAKKIVLFFDLCSSTLILEDLIRSERQKRWRSLLIALKVFLRKKSRELDFEIYKFIGDGWVLLFEPDYPADVLFPFMQELCESYDTLYKNKIKGVLSFSPKNIGIKFGLEKGSLMHMIMNGKKEYVGRALNVAARLQGAIKDNDSKPQGKVLMSNNVFVDFKPTLLGKFRIQTAERKLRNISGGEKYLAKKVCLFEKPIKKAKKKAKKKVKKKTKKKKQ